MNYRVEGRKSPANFSFGRHTIFHRVASASYPPRLLAPLALVSVPRGCAIVTIDYAVYFVIERVSSIYGRGLGL